MTNEINVGSLQIDEGFFLKREINVRPFQKPFNDEDTQYRFCYTYQGSPTTIKDYIIYMIRNAKKKVFIASFRIGEKDLLEALFETANRLKGGIYVITALNEKDLKKGLAEVEDDSDIDIKAQKKQFEELTQNGINVRGHSSCHAKFIIVDDNIALVSSANLETRAFSVTGECGVLITEVEEIDRLSRFFTRLWYSGCDWEIPPGTGYVVSQRAKEPCPCEVPLPLRKGNSGIIWTHGREEDYILKAIQDIILKTQRNIFLSTFSLLGMDSNPKLVMDYLYEAIESRGVNVEILLRARNHFSGHRRDTETLAKMGVKIHSDSLNHAKGIIADESIGALFSANYDAVHGLTSGVEMGIRLDKTSTLKNAIRYFNHAAKYCDREFILKPSQTELSTQLPSDWIKAWPLESTMKLKTNERNWQKFSSFCQKAPILFRQLDSGVVRVYSGNIEWSITAKNSEGIYYLEDVRRTEQDSIKTSKELLEEWLKPNRNRDNEEIKGFCTASFIRMT